ncbi:MAG: hypothetical protein GY696_26750 [Gammaproteobacteria bacterium]|nr:hypothetical protein [Gammaproteobacteria bacterium]
MLNPAYSDTQNRVSHRLLILVVTPLLINACTNAPKKPTLYPNAHLEQVGTAVAQQDIDACFASAREYGVNEKKDGQVGQKAASGAAIGAVSAGVWGLIRGDAGERALAGAASGAATGATVGAIDSRNLDPVFKNYVNKCLRDKGYEVIGWQ